MYKKFPIEKSKSIEGNRTIDIRLPNKIEHWFDNPTFQLTSPGDKHAIIWMSQTDIFLPPS